MCVLRDVDRYCLIEVSSLVPLRQFAPELDMADMPGSSRVRKPHSRKKARYRKVKVPARLDTARILVSILQLIWSISTLYDTRGNQLDLYGYGAFGLTVAPYAIMSFINLLVSLFYPSYTSMYLVWSPDMKEAMETEYDQNPGRSAGDFYGMVATVDVTALSRQVADRGPQGRLPYDFGIQTQPRLFAVYLFLYLLISVIPLIIVGALTGFRTGSDIRVERAWILAWLIVGTASAPLIRQVSVSIATPYTSVAFMDFLQGTSRMEQHEDRRTGSARYTRGGPNSLFWLFVLLPLWVPAIGGMVIVGQMLRDYGVCTRLS